jgi:hypothetical protein
MKEGLKVTGVTYGEKIDQEKSDGCRKNKIPATGITVKKPAEQIKLG